MVSILPSPMTNGMQTPSFELSAALCDELSAFRTAVLEGRTQIQLPAAVRAQLAAISLDAPASTPPGLSALAQKRYHIERGLARSTSRGRDVYTGELDVDEIFGRVQARVAHTSGLRMAAAIAPPSPKSSFDENDYYSSQVESAWSPAVAETNTTTLDAEDVPRKKRKLSQLDTIQPELEDDYVPADPVAASGAIEEEDDYEPSDSTRDDSDYEPDAVLQAAFSPPVPIVKNHLTHLAAPQPNRVSPLTTSAKGPGFELQLVDGRPEMVKIPRKMASQARLSSASPPARVRGKKLKKQRREAEPLQGRKKKKQSERHMGLDMSNQIMPRAEPQPAAAPYLVRPQTAQTRAFTEMPPPPPSAYAPPPGYALVQHASLRPYAYNVEAPRPASTMLQAPSDSSTFTTIYAQPPPEHVQYAAPMQQVQQVRYAMAPPPPPLPVQPSRRIVVDQFGNRYVEAEAEASPIHQDPIHHQIMRPMTVAPAEQYDPSNARFDMQPRPTPPAYPVEYIDGRRYRVREYVDSSVPHYEPSYQQMQPPPDYRPY